MSALDKSMEQSVTEAIIRNEAIRYLTEANRPDHGPTVRCLKCYGEIRSEFRHDMQTCKCGDISIDGGGSYTKMSAMPGSAWEEVKEEPPPTAA